MFDNLFDETVFLVLKKDVVGYLTLLVGLQVFLDVFFFKLYFDWVPKAGHGELGGLAGLVEFRSWI
jgi:hypothetical protein